MATFLPTTKLFSAVFLLTVGFSLASICFLLRRERSYIQSMEMKHLSMDIHGGFETSLRQYLSGNIKSEDLDLRKDDDAISKALNEKERVLCWIMTSPKNLADRARAVRDTWTRRCNKVLFMSSVTDPKFPTIGLKVQEGREHLTAKTMQAFRYIYKNHFDDADWFMKADDDTYVILENLRYFLTSQNTSEPVFFGYHYKVGDKQDYNQGGAGYVLSKEALRRYGEKGHDPKLCRHDGGSEDIRFSRCMQNLEVRIVNTNDALGRSRFHPFQPETYFERNIQNWPQKFDGNGANKGITNISDYAISFHHVRPQQMYALEFYTYYLRPYGLVYGTQELNRKKNI